MNFSSVFLREMLERPFAILLQYIFLYLFFFCLVLVSFYSNSYSHLAIIIVYILFLSSFSLAWRLLKYFSSHIFLSCILTYHASSNQPTNHVFLFSLKRRWKYDGGFSSSSFFFFKPWMNFLFFHIFFLLLLLLLF